MTHKTRTRIGLALLTSLSLFVYCGFALAVEFSADMVHTQGSVSNLGKIFVKDKKTRMEMSSSAGSTINIIDGATGNMWVLQPAQKMVIELKGQAQKMVAPQSDEEIAKIADRKVVGTENINGYECDKIVYTYHDKSLGSMTQWISKKLNYPLKMVYPNPQGEMIIEYKNIKEGGVADSVFAIPADYRRVQMPGTKPAPGGK